MNIDECCRTDRMDIGSVNSPLPSVSIRVNPWLKYGLWNSGIRCWEVSPQPYRTRCQVPDLPSHFRRVSPASVEIIKILYKLSCYLSKSRQHSSHG